MAVTPATWTPSSWRGRTALHQPEWPDAAAAEASVERLRALPPLVFAGEARELQAALGEVAAGRISDRAAWGAANLFYDSKKYGRQIYRVFVLLLEEDGRWTIPLSHFSNAGPIPGR